MDLIPKFSSIEDTVTAYAPGSIGNVCCGFDTLGMAISSPGDYVTLKIEPSNGLYISIAEISGDQGKLPTNAAKNTATVAIASYLKALNKTDLNISVWLEKCMPMNSGLGSSGASAVAALVALNHALMLPLALDALLPFALDAEATACGSRHADNVAASLLGGIVLCTHNISAIKLPINLPLYYLVVHPDYDLSTQLSRQAMPSTYSKEACVKQMSVMAQFITGINMGNQEMIRAGNIDLIAEPYRADLIPNFRSIKAYLDTIALVGGISGSGPSVFGLFGSDIDLDTYGKHIQQLFKEVGLDSQVYYGKVPNKGAYVL